MSQVKKNKKLHRKEIRKLREREKKQKQNDLVKKTTTEQLPIV